MIGNPASRVIRSHCPYSEPMGALELFVSVRLLKLLSVLSYAGAVGVSLFGHSVAQRKRAIHGVASPLLVLVWLAGYGLSVLQGIALTEAWIVLGFVGSFAAQAVLGRAAREGVVPSRVRYTVGALVALTVALMVLRPRWETFGL
jgi:uncharacterized membrane protein YeaQ/YmgE (transglycosylase-associated protein family)